MLMRPRRLVPTAVGLLLASAWLCPPLTGRAGAQAPPPPPAADGAVDPLLRPLLPRLRRTAHIPILLPPNIPGQGGPLVADLGVGDGQYTVGVHRAKAGQRLDFKNQVATVSGMRVHPRSHPMGGRRVVLAGGQTGRYLGPRGTASYAFLQWRQGGCVYDIGLDHGTLRQLTAMADWAIQHPIPPGRGDAGGE